MPQLIINGQTLQYKGKISFKLRSPLFNDTATFTSEFTIQKGNPINDDILLHLCNVDTALNYGVFQDCYIVLKNISFKGKFIINKSGESYKLYFVSSGKPESLISRNMRSITKKYNFGVDDGDYSALLDFLRNKIDGLSDYVFCPVYAPYVKSDIEFLNLSYSNYFHQNGYINGILNSYIVRPESGVYRSFGLKSPIVPYFFLKNIIAEILALEGISTGENAITEDPDFAKLLLNNAQALNSYVFNTNSAYMPIRAISKGKDCIINAAIQDYDYRNVGGGNVPYNWYSFSWTKYLRDGDYVFIASPNNNYGMSELLNKTYRISGVTDTTFKLDDVDSTNFTKYTLGTEYKGFYELTGSEFPESGGSGDEGAIKEGDCWSLKLATDESQLGGTTVYNCTNIVAKCDDPGQDPDNWLIDGTVGNLGIKFSLRVVENKIVTENGITMGNHMPDITFGDFIKELENFLFIKFVFSEQSNSCRIVKLDDILLNTESIDISQYHVQIPEITPKKTDGYEITFTPNGSDKLFSEYFKPLNSSFNMKGAVGTEADLPSSANPNDCYIVLDYKPYSAYFVYNGFEMLVGAGWKFYSYNLFGIKTGLGELKFSSEFSHLLPVDKELSSVGSGVKLNYKGPTNESVENCLQLFFYRLRYYPEGNIPYPTVDIYDPVGNQFTGANLSLLLDGLNNRFDRLGKRWVKWNLNTRKDLEEVILWPEELINNFDWCAKYEINSNLFLVKSIDFTNDENDNIILGTTELAKC